MGPRIDDLDRAILRLLQENARMPCAEMARRLGHVSARTVSNRIKRLTEENIVEISAGAAPEALGYAMKADVYLEVEPGMVREVAEAVARFDEVSYVAIVTGDADLSIQVNSRDIHDLQIFLTGELHPMTGVRRTRSFLILERLKQSCDWPFPEKLP